MRTLFRHYPATGRLKSILCVLLTLFLESIHATIAALQRIESYFNKDMHYKITSTLLTRVVGALVLSLLCLFDDVSSTLSDAFGSINRYTTNFIVINIVGENAQTFTLKYDYRRVICSILPVDQILRVQSHPPVTNSDSDGLAETQLTERSCPR